MAYRMADEENLVKIERQAKVQTYQNLQGEYQLKMKRLMELFNKRTAIAKEIKNVVQESIDFNKETKLFWVLLRDLLQKVLATTDRMGRQVAHMRVEVHKEEEQELALREKHLKKAYEDLNKEFKMDEGEEERLKKEVTGITKTINELVASTALALADEGS